MKYASDNEHIYNTSELNINYEDYMNYKTEINLNPTEDIINDIKSSEKLIIEYNKKIKNIKKRVETMKRIVYKNCSHHFIRDNSCASDDIYKYVCTKCNLYKGVYSV